MTEFKKFLINALAK